MNSPRVSVVIPVYNSGWSIGRTLASVFEQRFASYEVILVDDGSTDDLSERIAGYASRLRVIRQKNRGLAGARNRGVAESRAALIAPLDADDLWHPDYLSELVAALDASPGAPFAFCASYQIDEDDRVLPERHLRTVPRHDFLGLLSLNSVGSGSAAVFRRSDMLAADGYDETLRGRAAQGAEDWKLIVQLAARGTPALVCKTLVAYRLTRAGMSQRHPDRQLQAIDAVLTDLRREFPDVEKRYFKDARTMMTAWLLPAFLRRGMYGQAIRQACRAYMSNPLWWRNPNVALVHHARFDMMARALFSKPATLPHLKDLAVDGSKPFAFLKSHSAA